MLCAKYICVPSRVSYSEALQRRQALAGAQSSVNKVAQSIATASSAQDVISAPCESVGGAWVRDGGPRRLGSKEQSKRRILLKAARLSLERAQARFAATGEELKKKTDRGLLQASGTVARGLKKLIQTPKEGEEEHEVVTAARTIATYTANAAEVARMRELRLQQAQAGRYNGRQRRAAPVAAQVDAAQGTARVPASLAAMLGSEPSAISAPAVDAESLEVQERDVEREQNGIEEDFSEIERASDASTPSSFTFVSDEELLFAYSSALDELEDGDKQIDTDEMAIISMSVSRLALPCDLVPFAVERLYQLVGLSTDDLMQQVEEASQEQMAAPMHAMHACSDVASVEAAACAEAGRGRGEERGRGVRRRWEGPGERAFGDDNSDEDGDEGDFI